MPFVADNELKPSGFSPDLPDHLAPKPGLMDNIGGGLAEIFRGANKGSAQILNTGIDIGSIPQNILNPLLKELGVNTGNEPGEDLKRLTGVTDALKAPPSDFSQNNPVTGQVLGGLGEYLPEILLGGTGAARGVGSMAADRFASLAPEIKASIEKAIASGAGGLFGGLAKGDPEAAAKNALTFPFLEAGGEGLAKTLKPALQKVPGLGGLFKDEVKLSPEMDKMFAKQDELTSLQSEPARALERQKSVVLEATDDIAHMDDLMGKIGAENDSLKTALESELKTQDAEYSTGGQSIVGGGAKINQSQSLDDLLAGRTSSELDYKPGMSETGAGEDIHSPVRQQRIEALQAKIADNENYLDAAKQRRSLQNLRLDAANHNILPAEVDTTKLPDNFSFFTTDTAATKELSGQTPSALDRIAGPPETPKDIGKFTQARAAFTQSIRTSLNRLGPSGQDLAQRIDQVEVATAKNVGRADKIINENLKGLSQSEMENFVDVLDKGALPINDRVSKSSGAIKSLLGEVEQEAGAKVENFRALQNFFPRMFPKERINQIVTDKDWLGKTAAKLYEGGQYASTQEAEAALLKNIRNGFTGRRVSNLDFARLGNAEDWIRDPRVVLPKYFQQAYKRLAEIDAFGARDNVIKDLTNNIASQFGPNARKLVTDSMKSVLKDYESTTVGDVLGSARAYNTITKLGLAQIQNASQSANTVVKAGVMNTLKGLQRTFTKEGSDFAQEAGAFVDSIGDELASGSNLTSKFMKATGFKGTETFNRKLAANSGFYYAKSALAKAQQGSKLGMRQLEELGVDATEALKRGYLTQDELKTAAFKVTKATQFTNQPQDLPLFFDGPVGKTVAQFKSFAFQHAKFMTDQVLKEAAKGNPAPLLRTILATATFGELSMDAKELTKLKNPLKSRADETILRRGLEDFFGWGGWGLFTDMIKSAQYGKSGLADFLGGATITTTGEILSTLAKPGSDLLQGNMPDMSKIGIGLGRVGVKQIPVIGNQLSKGLFPSQKGRPKKEYKDYR